MGPDTYTADVKGLQAGTGTFSRLLEGKRAREAWSALLDTLDWYPGSRRPGLRCWLASWLVWLGWRGMRREMLPRRGRGGKQRETWRRHGRRRELEGIPEWSSPWEDVPLCISTPSSTLCGTARLPLSERSSEQNPEFPQGPGHRLPRPAQSSPLPPCLPVVPFWTCSVLQDSRPETCGCLESRSGWVLGRWPELTQPDPVCPSPADPHTRGHSSLVPLSR